jgi:hypothetical protein
LLGFEQDRSTSGGIRAEEGRVDPVVGVVGVGPGGAVAVNDEDVLGGVSELRRVEMRRKAGKSGLGN